MKRGPISWTSKVAPAELQAVHDYIDSDAGYQAADIYRHLALERYCSTRTFRAYVATRRAANEDRAPLEEGALPPSSFSLDSLEEMSRSVIGKALLTAEMPAYALPKLLASLARMKVAAVTEDENRRRQEWHEQKMKQACAKLDDLGKAVPELTPELLGEIKSKVLGL